MKERRDAAFVAAVTVVGVIAILLIPVVFRAVL